MADSFLIQISLAVTEYRLPYSAPLPVDANHTTASDNFSTTKIGVCNNVASSHKMVVSGCKVIAIWSSVIADLLVTKMVIKAVVANAIKNLLATKMVVQRRLKIALVSWSWVLYSKVFAKWSQSIVLLRPFPDLNNLLICPVSLKLHSPTISKFKKN